MYIYILFVKKKFEEINDCYFGYNNMYFECVVDWLVVFWLKCLFFFYVEEF